MRNRVGDPGSQIEEDEYVGVQNRESVVEGGFTR